MLFLKFLPSDLAAPQMSLVTALFISSSIQSVCLGPFAQAVPSARTSLQDILMVLLSVSQVYTLTFQIRVVIYLGWEMAQLISSFLHKHGDWNLDP